MIAIRYADGVDDSSVVSRIAHESCARAPSLLAKGHWWEELDRDFARRPEGFELALYDRLRVGAAASFDTVLRTAGASMISSMALPLGYNPIELRKAVRDTELYADIAESADPGRFFATPPTGVRVRAKKGRWLPRFEALADRSPAVHRPALAMPRRQRPVTRRGKPLHGGTGPRRSGC